MGCRCDDIGYQCSCINVTIKRADNPLQVSISRVDSGILADVYARLGVYNSSIASCRENLRLALHRAENIHSVTVTPICGVGTGDILRFSVSKLLWSNKDNYVGNVKYNTLISSEDWVLEEIEELL